MCSGEYDSEDDEGYFLTPVLQYDISDKIIEANKALFASAELPHANNDTKKVMVKQRRVTFAKVLLSYAPDVQCPASYTTEDERNVESKLNETVAGSMSRLTSLEEIAEELDADINCNEEQNALLDRKKSLVLDSPFGVASPFLTLSASPPPTSIADEQTKTTTTTTADDDAKLYEELVEKIEQPLISHTDSSSPCKQNSTPLSSPATNIINIYTNVEEHFSSNASDDDDNDNDHADNDISSMEISVSARSKTKKPTSRTSSNKPAVSYPNRSQSANKSKTTVPKFNYKTCCEYAAAATTRQPHLPRYNGYVSEYGLSREERERLPQLRRRQYLNLLEQEARTNDEMMRRLTANEQAFRTWLNNKCRRPINRTRNMFDFKGTQQPSTVISKSIKPGNNRERIIGNGNANTKSAVKDTVKSKSR